MSNDERTAMERGKGRDRRVREAVELLDAGVERILDGEEFKRYLAFAARFHRYSANNSLLILVQRPGATRVAGYRRWRELGRQVRRGEDGIRILAPIFRTVEDEESGEKARILCSFKVVKVFDVSQTDPVPGTAPLPEKPRPAALPGCSPAARTLARSLARLCEAEGLELRDTHQQYAALVHRYLIPGIGKIKLTEITAQDLDDLYADMEERGVGERTARYVHQVVSSALERAARKHLVPFNVARYADPPPMPEGEEQLALTLEELSCFFEVAANTRFENYFVVSALCGARPQEILGLKWSDVKLPKEPGVPGEATIRRRISIDGSGRWDVLEGTKTSRKNKRAKARAVYLMPEVVEALNRERKTYLEKRLRLAERWEETWREYPETRDLIFPSETGGPMNRNNLLRRHFTPLAEKAGLPKEARLYTLRHTFATLWMESNEPVKVLQEILGHSRIDQTMNTYAHVMPHIQADAFGRFSRRFSQG